MSFKVSDEKAFELLTCLQKQFECYSSLILLSIEQGDCVKNSDEEGLFKALEKKQKIIEEVDNLSQQFIEEKQLLENTPMGEFSCIDQELDEVLKAMETGLQKLIENETRDMDLLQKSQEEHHDKMEHLHRGKHVANAYLNKGGNSKMDRQV